MKTYVIFLAAMFSSLLALGQATEYTFTIEGMTCDACANTAIKTLNSIEGVDSVKVDFKTKTAIVFGAATKERIKTQIKKNTNFEAIFEGEEILKPLSNEIRKNLNIKNIKGAKKLKFKDHLAEGTITIFDFYAIWCGPCHIFSPKLEHFIKNNPKIALRKVDIDTWESEVSKQLTKLYKIPALPFTLIFNSKGELIGRVEGNRIEEVEYIVKSNLE